jgi:hypothetical protein
MKFPLYLYYELLVRLAEFRPEIGSFVSVFASDSHLVLSTDTGVLEISSGLMYRQFNDPDTVSKEEIRKLAGDFQLHSEFQGIAVKD